MRAEKGDSRLMTPVFEFNLYDQYLALLERCLTGSIYVEEYTRVQMLRGSIQGLIFRPIAALLRTKH
jgi:hypothetical protein